MALDYIVGCIWEVGIGHMVGEEFYGDDDSLLVFAKDLVEASRIALVYAKEHFGKTAYVYKVHRKHRHGIGLL